MHDPTVEDAAAETETINVVPLADLTLVLLIILMVLSPMISQSMIRVATPQVSAGAETTETETSKRPLLLVTLREKGYALNRESFETSAALFGRLRERLADDPKPSVIVSAENGVFVGEVVEVLDNAKRWGAQEVSLVKNISQGSTP